MFLWSDPELSYFMHFDSRIKITCLTMNNSSVFLQTLIYVMNQSAIQEEVSYNYYFLNIGKEMNATRCYGSYGCFALSPPWTSEHRPVSLFPEELIKIEPNYYLYSRKNPHDPIVFDLNDFDPIESSGMDPLLNIYVISHGFLEAGDRNWIKVLIGELLIKDDCSIIVVDWHKGSGPPYTQAVANIRLVGAMTAHLLAELAKYTGSKKLDHVHCIGHSLGAHLSAYAGYTLQKDFGLTVGRITGLDPAEPHFAKANPPVRLDRSAAYFVDVIHTDANMFIKGGLGIIERVGHVDYYPNGGSNQPGCGKSVVQYISAERGSFLQGIRKFLGCNHIRSYEFFTESINTKCSFMTISCSSYDEFKKGNCFDCGKKGQHCLKFGYHSIDHYRKLLQQKVIRSKNNLIQYLLTGEHSPFCKSHFRVTVDVSKSNESMLHGGEIGQLWFIFHSRRDGTGQNSGKVALNDGGYHEPGAQYRAVIAADSVSNLRAVEVEWRYHSSVFNPLTWRLLASPRVYLSQVIVESLETNQRITICPQGNKPLVSGVSQIFSSTSCNE